jgi:orotate phosphoribosyltransferase
MDNTNLIWLVGLIGNLSIALILTIFAIFSVIQALQFFGVRIWKLSNAIDRRERERVESTVEALFDEQRDYIRRKYALIGEEMLNSLGLKRTGLHQIRSKIIELMHQPMDTQESLTEALRRVITLPNVLIDTNSIKDPLYREVTFYFNLIDACSDETLGPVIGDILANYIRSSVSPEQLQEVTLVVPNRGNFMLGVHVSRCLRKDVILLRDKPRLSHGQYWDGILEPNRVALIVHDVAVTGSQLMEAQRTMATAGHKVLGVFSLIERSNKVDYQKLQVVGLKLNSVLKLKDNQIVAMMQNVKK